MVESKQQPFVISLPDGYSLAFDVSTPQYTDLPKMAATTASSSAKAVSNYLFRTFRDKNIAKRIYKALRNCSEDLSDFAFEVPEIVAEDRRPIEGHLFELLQEGELAKSLAMSFGGTTRDNLPQAQKLMEFYRTHRH